MERENLTVRPLNFIRNLQIDSESSAPEIINKNVYLL